MSVEKNSKDIITDLCINSLIELPKLSHEEIRKLAKQLDKKRKRLKKALDGSNKKRVRKLRKHIQNIEHRFAISHLKLVVSISQKYRFLLSNNTSKVISMSWLDLIQEGYLGLFEAIKKYQWGKGEFSIYAILWIKSFIREAIRKNTQEVLSLDNFITHDTERTLNFIEDKKTACPINQANHHVAIEMLLKTLRILDPVRKRVIVLFYGLENEGCHTFTQIGRIINRSAVRVGQLYRTAIKKLRNQMNSQKHD